MPRVERLDDSEDDLEPLVDTTEALTLRSKRTKRAQKKQQKINAKKAATKPAHGSILDLPYELLMDIFTLLVPSDVFNLQRVNRAFHALITEEDARIAKSIVSWRYHCLERCFRLPILLKNVDEDMYPILHSTERQKQLHLDKKPYQHIKSPDQEVICTCMTCVPRWNFLCIVVDFAHWQQHLDKGEPIPLIPRGRYPEWNEAMLARNALIVQKALYSPMWHARLLEEHLKSTTRSISRHAANKGNQRRRFRMTREDMESRTDLFLERSGPPTIDMPFHRDNYYMLEAFMPNRAWISEANEWRYLPAEQHDTDLRILTRWANWWASERERKRKEKLEADVGKLRAPPPLPPISSVSPAVGLDTPPPPPPPKEPELSA